MAKGSKKVGASPEALKRARIFDQAEVLRRAEERREGKYLPADVASDDEVLEPARRIRIRTCVTLDPETLKLAKKAGDSNVSRGLDIGMATWWASLLDEPRVRRRK